MKKTILSFALFAATTLSAQNLKEIVVGHPFKITYPSNYVKTYDLNDTASLQIMNAVQEKFTIIIQDDREALDALKVIFNNNEEALTYYSKEMIDGLDNNNSKKISPIKNYKINDNDLSEISIEGQMKDEESNEVINFFYLFTVIKTPTNYYQIVSWTRLENRNKYEEEFRNIAKSFKEISIN